MPLTFPLDLRSLWDEGIRFHRPKFGLVSRVATAQLPGGLQTVETAPAQWRATWRTVPLEWRDANKVHAFLDALGGARRFLGYDTFRPWPSAHLAGAGGISATYTASVTTGNRITISGAAGLTIRRGDHLGFENAAVSPTRRCLLRAVEDVTAVAGVLTVEVSPSINTLFATGSFTLRVYRPAVTMILDPTAPPDSTDLVNRTEFSFSGVQAA